MAVLSFFTTAGITTLGNIGDSMVAWYAQHDPETAGEVDIADLGQRANALAHRIAEIQGRLEHDQHTVSGLTDKLTRDKQAAGIVGARLKAAKAANDAVQVTQFAAQLKPVLDEIADLGGDDGNGTGSGQLFEAQQTLAADTADLAQFREAHAKAMSDWTTARQRLDRAKTTMQHAELQKHDAESRAAEAARDAGLLHGSRPGHTALDAMEQKAATMRIDATAATIQADALRHTGGADVADIVNSALAGEHPDHGNDQLDRLAKLTGGA